MALSIVRWRGEHDGFQEFEADIGSNSFYAWGVGSGVRSHDGIPVLGSRTQSSPLVGPLEPGSRGRVQIRIPTDAFTSEDHHLQLLSFRDEELRGPAVSDLIAVPWRWTRPLAPTLVEGGEEQSMSIHTLPVPSHAASAPPVGPLPGSPRLSEAQFLGALGGLISQVLPIVKQMLPVVHQIGRFISTPPATNAPTPPVGSSSGMAPATPSAPDLGQLLTQVLDQVQRALAAAPPSTPPTPAAPTPAAQASLATSAPHYAYASMAPLLAALPALAPLLQSLLTPQTVQSLIGAADPSRLLQTTFAGLMDAARIGQQATDQLHAHLRALNPGTGDDVLLPLLAAMSTAASDNDRSPRHRVSRLVQLEVPDLAPVELQGYPQVAFRWGEDLILPVIVRTPRPIRRARLQVCVKDASTHQRLAERTVRLPVVEDGRLPEPVQMPAAVTHRLTPGREYLVSLRLLWQGRDDVMGATTAQLVRLVGPAVFDSVDTGGPPVRLDDVDRDRDWWHQVWTDTVDERSSRLRARLDYDYRIAPGGPTNRRHDTRVDLDPVTRRRNEGSLHAGLGVTLASLSQLAERLDGNGFDDDTMRALSDPAFREAFNRTATCQVSLHGRRHARLAIWVWPEVKLHDVFLRTPGDISPTTGQVLSFETNPVKVPIPALAHVLTTRSA